VFEEPWEVSTTDELDVIEIRIYQNWYFLSAISSKYIYPSYSMDSTIPQQLMTSSLLTIVKEMANGANYLLLTALYSGFLIKFFATISLNLIWDLIN